MPNEKQPPHTRKTPLPQDYRPPKSIPRPVGGASGPPGKPEDTWESVARQYNLDVQKLIRHNFHTNIPEEVNWYLRRNVGCNVPSPSGWNWTFKGAKPGIIYIPIKEFSFDDDGVIEGYPGVTEEEWDEMREGAEEAFSLHGQHLLHEMLEGVSGAHSIAAIFADIGAFAELAELLEFPAIGAEILGVLAIGLAHADAITKKKREQLIWGLSYGTVLAADNRPGSFIQSMGFKEHRLYETDYPQEWHNFDLAYLMGLAIGVKYGKKLNTRQRNSLRKAVRAHMTMTKYPPLSEPSKWTSKDFKNYYQDAGIAFRKYVLEL